MASIVQAWVVGTHDIGNVPHPFDMATLDLGDVIIEDGRGWRTMSGKEFDTKYVWV
jgi:hypothetical protein